MRSGNAYSDRSDDWNASNSDWVGSDRFQSKVERLFEEDSAGHVERAARRIADLVGAEAIAIEAMHDRDTITVDVVGREAVFVERAVAPELGRGGAREEREADCGGEEVVSVH